MTRFSLTALLLDARRALRNRRTMLFVLVFPSLFFLLMRSAGSKPGANPAADAYLLISMAVYGAMVAMTAGGAAVAVERSVGWSRQLRLTPLRASSYIAMKIMVAMVLGLIAVVVSLGVGAFIGVRLPLTVWFLSGLTAWLASLVFAAFGLFMGFLLPSENVMQFVGPAMAMMAMCGGLFVPVEHFAPSLRKLAMLTPAYGVGALARAPLAGAITAASLASVATWTLLFGGMAAWLFSRDTGRV